VQIDPDEQPEMVAFFAREVGYQQSFTEGVVALPLRLMLAKVKFMHRDDLRMIVMTGIGARAVETSTWLATIERWLIEQPARGAPPDCDEDDRRLALATCLALKG
jgi:hypothetical protein